jgi:hypothetical protein
MNSSLGFIAAKALQLVAAGTVLSSCVACGIIKEKPASATDDLIFQKEGIPPEKADKILNEVGGNFAYGPGLGDAAVNIGTVVVFPPYAVYLIGNAVLSLSGYEPITVSSLLPEKDGEQWSETYDTVVSVPGRFVAAMAGHEYRTREVGEERMRSVLRSRAEVPMTSGERL